MSHFRAHQAVYQANANRQRLHARRAAAQRAEEAEQTANHSRLGLLNEIDETLNLLNDAGNPGSQRWRGPRLGYQKGLIRKLSSLDWWWTFHTAWPVASHALEHGSTGPSGMSPGSSTSVEQKTYYITSTGRFATKYGKGQLAPSNKYRDRLPIEVLEQTLESLRDLAEVPDSG